MAPEKPNNIDINRIGCGDVSSLMMHRRDDKVRGAAR